MACSNKSPKSLEQFQLCDNSGQVSEIAENFYRDDLDEGRTGNYGIDGVIYFLGSANPSWTTPFEIVIYLSQLFFASSVRRESYQKQTHGQKLASDPPILPGTETYLAIDH